MLSFTRSVPDTVPRIMAPLARQLVENMIDSTGARTVIGDNVVHNDTTHKIAHSRDEDNNPILPTDNRVIYNQTNTFDPSSLNWDPLYISPNNTLISGQRLDRLPFSFHDSVHNITLSELGNPCMIEMEIGFYINAREKAYEIYDNAREALMIGRGVQIHEFIIDWAVHPHIVTVLKELHKLTGFPEDDFPRWLIRESDGAMAMRVNTVQPNRNLMGIRRRLTNVQVAITSEVVEPEAIETENSTITHALRYNAIIQFSRPFIQWLRYPVAINNQPIPAFCVDNSALPKTTKKPVHSPFVDMENWRRLKDNSNKMIVPLMRSPWYDNWSPPNISYPMQRGWKPISSCVFYLDDLENPEGTTVLDLNDLPDMVRPNSELLSKLNKEDSPCHPVGDVMVAVFRNDAFVDHSDLSVDGSVITIKDRNPSPLHRLVFFINPKSRTWEGTKFVFLFDIITSPEER